MSAKDLQKELKALSGEVLSIIAYYITDDVTFRKFLVLHKNVYQTFLQHIGPPFYPTSNLGYLQRRIPDLSTAPDEDHLTKEWMERSYTTKFPGAHLLCAASYIHLCWLHVSVKMLLSCDTACEMVAGLSIQLYDIPCMNTAQCAHIHKILSHAGAVRVHIVPESGSMSRYHVSNGMHDLLLNLANTVKRLDISSVFPTRRIIVRNHTECEIYFMDDNNIARQIKFIRRPNVLIQPDQYQLHPSLVDSIGLMRAKYMTHTYILYLMYFVSESKHDIKYTDGDTDIHVWIIDINASNMFKILFLVKEKNQSVVPSYVHTNAMLLHPN